MCIKFVVLQTLQLLVNIMCLFVSYYICLIAFGLPIMPFVCSIFGATKNYYYHWFSLFFVIRCVTVYCVGVSLYVSYS